jgi:hypothetical protein
MYGKIISFGELTVKFGKQKASPLGEALARI